MFRDIFPIARVILVLRAQVASGGLRATSWVANRAFAHEKTTLKQLPLRGL